MAAKVVKFCQQGLQHETAQMQSVVGDAVDAEACDDAPAEHDVQEQVVAAISDVDDSPSTTSPAEEGMAEAEQSSFDSQSATDDLQRLVLPAETQRPSQGSYRSHRRSRDKRPSQDEDPDSLLSAADTLLTKRWVAEDSASIIFEDPADEQIYHQRRSEALGIAMRVLTALRNERERLLHIQDAGAALLEDFDRLQRKNVELAGEAAYWQAMAEEATSELGSKEGQPSKAALKGGA
eukprot:CAMPEP_0178414040 /NCGR_PEP_ID=MMETSP0689_2-20121128/22833_1 /TAXON_ID=160604 /ORGANISM="Amphidinium massartii, Strain CS-259" /LENGTH=235 /DNA_ID=CAMNT_0020035321 /DNA_START=201 /DNA_END=909 /DNA_ORIENTATION=+